MREGQIQEVPALSETIPVRECQIQEVPALSETPRQVREGHIQEVGCCLVVPQSVLSVGDVDLRSGAVGASLPPGHPGPVSVLSSQQHLHRGWVPGAGGRRSLLGQVGTLGLFVKLSLPQFFNPCTL